jgi:hypothetical protein
VIERRQWRVYAGIVALGMVVTALALGQAGAQAQPLAQAEAASQPKFAGGARSQSEALALGYMRTMLRAQREYKKRHNHYAESLAALAGTGSFTKRMAQSTDRGDYTASFRPHRGSDKEGFILTMTPKQIDAEHRSFYAEEDGVIHGDDQKAADAESPKVK